MRPSELPNAQEVTENSHGTTIVMIIVVVYFKPNLFLEESV